MNGKHQAYPTPATIGQQGTIQKCDGLTIRDHIAIEAMKAILSVPQTEWDFKKFPDGMPATVCKCAYVMADAMIKQSNETPG